MTTPRLKLSREVRFGLHAAPPAWAHATPGGSNGFAANPALQGLAPFVCLTVTVEGPIDPSTGMLINIKTIDSVVRETAVEPLLRWSTTAPLKIGEAALSLFDHLAPSLAGREQMLDSISLSPSPYLRVAVHREEKPMVRLTERFEFSASHRLHSPALSEQENREVFGRCNYPNGHGHNYELEVTVTGKPDPVTGMVMSVPILQRLVNQHIVDVFDHKHLNLDCADFRELNPTVENIARVIYRRLMPHIPGSTGGEAVRLAAIRLWETPKTMCEYAE
jgi:6-pyruvoyltetrahydropterin/6-carboxytetrahydropterin synthase